MLVAVALTPCWQLCPQFSVASSLLSHLARSACCSVVAMAAVVESKLVPSPDSPEFVYSCASGPSLKTLNKDAFVSQWIAAAEPDKKRHSATANSEVACHYSSAMASLPLPAHSKAVFYDQIKSQASCHRRCCQKKHLTTSIRTSDMKGLDPNSSFARRRAYSETPVFRADALSCEWRYYVDNYSQLFPWRQARVKKRVSSFKLDGSPISDRYKQFLCDDAGFYYQNEWRLIRVHQPINRKRTARKSSTRSCATA